MSHMDHDFDDLIGALRTELPTARDQERIRARLEAAGVLAAGAGVMAGTAATAGTAAMKGASATSGAAPGAFSSLAPKSLLAAKLAALGTVPKVMVVAASISVVSAPVAVQLWTQESAAPAEARPLSAERRERPVDGRLAVPRKVEEQALPKAAAAPALQARVPSSTKAPLQEAKVLASAVPELEPRERKAVTHGSLKDETALIEQALSALRHGDVETARLLLNEHRQTFPQGALVPERNRALQRIDLEAKKNSLTEQ